MPEVSKIQIVSLVCSVVALTVTAFTGYYVMQSVNIQHISIRPILSFSDIVLEYDTQNIKIGVRVTNLGSTTAVVESVGVSVSINETDGTQLWLPFPNALIYPGKSQYRSLYRRRYEKTQDIVASIRKMPLSFSIAYGCEELIGKSYSTSVSFRNMTWHNKSIVGVKPD